MLTRDLTQSDQRFSTLRDQLASLEPGMKPVPEETDGRTHAAVSVILRQGEELEILLIKRAEAEGDPWSGQMALPGGRRDPSDENLLRTAVRETLEETSVRLEKGGIHLGRLEPMVPATKRLPPITIYPFVFAVDGEAEATVSSREVDEVLWVPLATLQAPGAASTVEIHYADGSSREFPCIRVDGRVIWGLTFRILTGFFQILRGAESSSDAAR